MLNKTINNVMIMVESHNYSHGIRSSIQLLNEKTIERRLGFYTLHQDSENPCKYFAETWSTQACKRIRMNAARSLQRRAGRVILFPYILDSNVVVVVAVLPLPAAGVQLYLLLLRYSYFYRYASTPAITT